MQNIVQTVSYLASRPPNTLKPNAGKLRLQSIQLQTEKSFYFTRVETKLTENIPIDLLICPHPAVFTSPCKMFYLNCSWNKFLKRLVSSSILLLTLEHCTVLALHAILKWNPYHGVSFLAWSLSLWKSQSLCYDPCTLFTQSVPTGLVIFIT